MLLTVVLIIVVTLFILYLVQNYIPMPPKVKVWVLAGIAIIAIIILLVVLGVVHVSL